MIKGNARRYGKLPNEIVLGISRFESYTWYTVLGSKGRLLDFMIHKNGRRQDVRSKEPRLDALAKAAS